MLKHNSLPFGLVLGLLSPLIPFLLFYLIGHHEKSLQVFVADIYRTKIFAPLISLCVLINLGLFYLLINKLNYPAARGIILATLIYAFIVAYVKFFT